ncbi:MAG: sodium:proton antiporter [Ilumatobacteraceae bacterium]
MTENLVVVIAAVLVAGVLAQWLGWKLRVPPIVFLLAMGLLAGPVTGVLDPDKTFGAMLFPGVSLAVAVILFEGSLGLGWRGLREAGSTVWKLLTIGVIVSLIGVSVSARLILGVDWKVAVLLAAVLVVTGPTVIGPIVSSIGLRGRVGAILESEGTLIDPIGAILTVLVFEALFVTTGSGVVTVAVNVILTLVLGALIGFVLAGLLVLVMAKYLVPDHLLNVTTLAAVLAAFAIANELRPESGLVAVTVMGIALATQQWVPVHRVLEFNETLRILFISGLFLLLGARITRETLQGLEWRNLVFLVALIAVVRPVGVIGSTIGSTVTRKERMFLAMTAPRGIVAASVASVFALKLADIGVADSQVFVSVVFTVIAGTVLMSGLLSKPLGVRWGLIEAEERTVIVFGANAVAQAFAGALGTNSVPARLIDLNSDDLQQARMTGLKAHRGSVISDATWDAAGIEIAGSFVAMSKSDELNALASLRATRSLGRKWVFQLAPARREHDVESNTPVGAFGRRLFAKDATYDRLSELIETGWRTASTPITEQFGVAEHAEVHPDAIPMFIVDPNKQIHIICADNPRAPRPGDVLVCLVAPRE